MRFGRDRLQARQGFRLLQYTASGCGPLAGTGFHEGGSHCPQVYAWTLHQIAKVKPDTVIIAANWDQGRGPSGRRSLNSRRRTIDAVRKAGVRRIIVLGQLPLFDVPQPFVGMRELPLGHLYSSRHLVRRCFETDQVLAKVLEGTRVEFVRPLELLCDGEGRRESVSRSPFQPLAYDYGHLTVAGSRFPLVCSGLKLGKRPVCHPLRPDRTPTRSGSEEAQRGV